MGIQQLLLSYKISAGGGGDTELATDTFTSGTNQALTTYSGSWTLMQGGFVVNTDGICYGSVNQTNLARWNANTFNASHYITGVLGNVTASNYPGLAVACQSGSSSAYYFILATGGYNEFGRTNSGSDTVIDTSPTTTWATGDVVRMEVSQPDGSTTRVVVKRAAAATPTSFSTVLTYDDTSGSRLTGGGAGLGAYGNNAGLAGLTSVAMGNM